MLNTVFTWLRNKLRYSAHVHFRKPVSDLRALVGVMDRFVDGAASYELEWDDFISWTNTNPNLEEIRNTLGAYEPMLFSRNRDRQLAYRKKVVELRNVAAAKVGIPPRKEVTEILLPIREGERLKPARSPAADDGLHDKSR